MTVEISLGSWKFFVFCLHYISRWKGERLLKTVLEAGKEAMGIAGKPYRIGTVKQVYYVVSSFDESV